MPSDIDARVKPLVWLPGFDSSTFALVKDAVSEQCRRWIVYRATVRELESLSERALSDLGISRADIREVARQSAE